MSLLAVENLSVAYGDLFAVRDVSFAVEQGTVFVLLGANGAGKTSILRTHLRAYPGARRPRDNRCDKPQRPVAASGRADRHLARPGRAPRISQPHRRGQSDRQLSAGPAHDAAGAAMAAVYELFPRLAERRRQAGGTLVRRRTADAGYRARHDEFPQAADARRAVARPVAGAGRTRVRASGEIKRQGTTILLWSSRMQRAWRWPRAGSSWRMAMWCSPATATCCRIRISFVAPTVRRVNHNKPRREDPDMNISRTRLKA